MIILNLFCNLKIFILASLVPIILVLIFGDSMYVGLWYYILIPVVGGIIVSPLQPSSSFFSGMGIAIALTYMPFLISNWVSDMPEGFILFWHLFSFPGIILGLLSGAFFCKRTNRRGKTEFLIGFSSVMAGFLLSLLVIILIGLARVYS